jgi:hypothetical protein
MYAYATLVYISLGQSTMMFYIISISNLFYFTLLYIVSWIRCVSLSVFSYIIPYFYTVSRCYVILSYSNLIVSSICAQQKNT